MAPSSAGADASAFAVAAAATASASALKNPISASILPFLATFDAYFNTTPQSSIKVPWVAFVFVILKVLPITEVMRD